MSARVPVAARITRAWVRLYTSGLPADLRDTRRAEIDADLWNHDDDARRNGTPRTVVTIEMLLRTLLGVPDDLNWRLEVRRSTPMMSLSENHVRWLGIAGIAGGFLWAARYLVPLDPGPAVRAYGHVVLAILLLCGLAGFYAQQRAQSGRVARTGFALLLVSAGAWLALNVLGTVVRVDDGALVMNVLGVAFVLPIGPGFLLLSAGLKGRARLVPLAITAAFAAWVVLPRTPFVEYFPAGIEWKRGDSPLGVTAFFAMGAGLAVLGYSVFRNARRV